MKRLDNKVAVITGAALGIGRATALMFAREGAKVAVTDVLDQESGELVREINDAGGESFYWHLDVSNEENVKKVMQEVYNKWDALHILVNNAGISGVNAPTHEVTEEEWDRVMDINVKGVFLCTKHAIPLIRRTGQGSIVNLSSIYGIIGAPDVPPYHASKGAVREMSKTDALIYAPDNIRVNSVHPGFIWTPMVQKHLESQGAGMEEGKAGLAALHPIGRVGEPDDIAYGIVYLASDEAKFVTGEELVIDGGYIAR